VKITLKLFATFRDFLPSHEGRSALGMDVDERETVETLLQALGVPDDLPRIVLINGCYASEDHRFADGDVVSVFPPLIGGRSSTEN
jgi:molybdopterin converting factor small subunit